MDTLSLDELLIRRPEATFMLTVQGDSMIAAGIVPGDMLLVEKGGTPKNNDIVVAQVDDEWTLKYYTKDREGVCLEPANQKYKHVYAGVNSGGFFWRFGRTYGTLWVL